MVVLGVIYREAADTEYGLVILLAGVAVVLVDYTLVWKLCVVRQKRLVTRLVQVITVKSMEKPFIRMLRVSIGAYASYIRFAVPGTGS